MPFSLTHSIISLTKGVQAQAHDVADLLDKKRLRRTLERLLPVRRQNGGTQEPAIGRLRHPRFGRHVARTPLGGVLRHHFEWPGNHCVDTIVIDRTRCAVASMPSSQFAAKRIRHIETVCRDTDRLTATSMLSTPVAHSRTIN